MQKYRLYHYYNIMSLFICANVNENDVDQDNYDDSLVGFHNVKCFSCELLCHLYLLFLLLE